MLPEYWVIRDYARQCCMTQLPPGQMRYVPLDEETQLGRWLRVATGHASDEDLRLTWGEWFHENNPEDGVPYDA
jgi:hypothetical protein